MTDKTQWAQSVVIEGSSWIDGRVEINGHQLKGVMAITWNIAHGELPTLTLTTDNGAQIRYEANNFKINFGTEHLNRQGA